MSNDLQLARETLKHRLRDLPDKIRPHVKMGFHLLAKATPDQRNQFLGYLLDITEKGENLDRDLAVKIVGLDSHTINDVLSTIAMVISATVDSDVSTNDFIEFGRGAVFEEVDQEVARQVVDFVISRRAPLEAGMKDSALANSVLPSFQGIWIEVDLRLRFENDNQSVSSGVAIAVCNLKTDSTDDVWFQMSASDVDDLIDKLKKVSSQLKAAETVATRMAL